ncbi:MAG: hypothetical protein ACRBB3_00605 [Alphaproteobacteria bacterium]
MVFVMHVLMTISCFLMFCGASHASELTLADDKYCNHMIKGVSPLLSYEDAKSVFLSQGLHILYERNNSFTKNGKKHNLRRMMAASYKDTANITVNDFSVSWGETASFSHVLRNGTETVEGVSVSISLRHMGRAKKSKAKGWETKPFAPYVKDWISDNCVGDDKEWCRITKSGVRANFRDTSKTQRAFIPHCSLSITTIPSMRETVKSYPVGKER